MTTLTLDVPDEIIALLGTPEVAAARAKETLVLDLLREARISQSAAARLLGVTRWGLLDLMARYQIPSGPETPEEMQEEIARARSFLSSR